MGEVTYPVSPGPQRVWVGSQAEALALFHCARNWLAKPRAELEDKVGSQAWSQTHGRGFCRLLPPVILQATLDSISLVLQIRRWGSERSKGLPGSRWHLNFESDLESHPSGASGFTPVWG